MRWVIHTGNFIHDFAAGCEVNSLFITDTSIYVARENGQINVSTDNGATWQTLTSPLGNYPLQNPNNGFGGLKRLLQSIG